MRSRPWSCVGAVTLLVLFASGTPVAAQQKEPAKGAAVDVKKVIEAWIFPEAVKEKQWSNFSASPKEPNPSVAFRSTARPYKEVWSFYAKKCGSDAKYEKNDLGGGQDQNGTYVYFSRPRTQDGEERACFVRVERGYAVTVTIGKKKDGGADLDIICVVR